MANMDKDPEADGWEKTDFPVVCEECLGPNPYVRMMKEDYGSECAISGRPFTVFRWKPGADARFKKTVVCKEVALAKNVCQVCLLDLEFGVPVQVRDAVLNSGAAGGGGGGAGVCPPAASLPASAVGKEYVTEQMAKALQEGGHMAVGYTGGGGGKMTSEKAALLRKIAGRDGRPYYKKNKSRICTFWMKGACTRADCPYRPCNGDYDMPELTSSHELRNQNMKDRYYGMNDPVANKMLNRMNERGRGGAGDRLTPPADTSITTVFLGGVTDASVVNERALNSALYSHGEIKSVRVIADKRCAFVTFLERAAAERCVAACGLSGVTVGEGAAAVTLNLSWAKPAARRGPGPGPGAGAGAPPQAASTGPGPSPNMYPSQNPHAMGSTGPR